MITSIDFVGICVGCGILIMSVTWSAKIIIEVRAKNRAMREALEREYSQPQPLDLMNQRLQEFRNSRFGVHQWQVPMRSYRTVEKPTRQKQHLRSVPNKGEDEK